MNQIYIDTVRLLLQVAPHVFASGRFGLKGGTALNLFVHEMPRLSVDIDVAFLDPALSREEALVAIGTELARVKTALERLHLKVQMPTSHDAEDVKLVVSNAQAQVKVEVNQVFRGSVMACERRSLVAAAEHLFTTSVTLPVLADAELYGSKLVAAFDRQHPRDWFDVLHMRRRGGLTSQVVACFVAYMAGHNRPIHEVLFPNLKAMGPIYEAEFEGLTIEDVPLADLECARRETLADVPAMLSMEHRGFLLSLARAEPEWQLMPFARLSELPAVRWKLLNLQRLRTRNRRKFAEQHDLLEARLAAV